MAMIKCPECGNDVSDRAIACLKCGYPVGRRNFMRKIIILQIVMVAVMLCIFWFVFTSVLHIV